MLYSFLGFLHTSSVLPSSIWNAETSPSEAQTEKASSFWKKHERQILKARQLFQKAGGLFTKRSPPFRQDAETFFENTWKENAFFVGTVWKNTILVAFKMKNTM